ncbi:MAG TPA: discoidin domain-containing protein, partial [Verrucomicrobiota bacterium]|nr:discoidin domain-containing protein [Verrucomicrobiota bacterium]
GQELPKSGWKLVYASSEEVFGEDGSADRALDGDRDTFWHTRWDGAQDPPPHYLVLDLGAVETVTGLRYLPRQDQANGRINAYRIYVRDEPFPGL